MHSPGRRNPGSRHRTKPDAARGLRGARVLAAAVLACALAGSAVAAAGPDAPVAAIGGEAISGSEFALYLRGYLRSKLYHGGSRERIRELADEALDRLITERLLLREAERRGIAADEAAVAGQIEALRAQYSGSETWPEVEPQLPAIAEKLRADSRIEALRAAVTEVAPPTEAELAAFYEANIGLFTEPAAWDLDLVLLGVAPSALRPEWDAAKETADSLVAELRAGGSFEEIAAEHSTDSSAKQGGRLGRMHGGQMPANVQAAVAQLAPGEITDPIRVLEGYAVLRMNAAIPQQTHPLAKVRERAESLYVRNKGVEQWETLVADLRSKTPVETFDMSALLEALVSGE